MGADVQADCILSLYSLHVLNSDVNMIQRNKQNITYMTGKKVNTYIV